MTDITERLRYAAKRIGDSNAVCLRDPANDMIVLGRHLIDAADLIDLLRAERRTLKERNRRNEQ